MRDRSQDGSRSEASVSNSPYSADLKFHGVDWGCVPNTVDHSQHVFCEEYRHGLILPVMLQRWPNQILNMLFDRDAGRRALARWLSTPRQTGLDFLIDPAHIRAADPATALIRHGGARLLCHGDTAWLNGEPWPLNQGQKPLARLLARQRRGVWRGTRPR